MKETTRHHIKYPEGTDLVRNASQQFQDMAQSIDDNIDDLPDTITQKVNDAQQAAEQAMQDAKKYSAAAQTLQDGAVSSLIDDQSSQSYRSVINMLGDVVVQRDNVETMVPRRRVYINCTFDRDYPGGQLRTADDLVFVGCRFAKPAGRLWAMSGRDSRRGLARATFVNCVFSGAYSGNGSDFRNHQIVFDQMAGLEFRNCEFMDIGIRVQASGETGRLMGTMDMSGCRFERSDWDVYRTIGDETSPDFSYKEYVSVSSKYMCRFDSCVFEGQGSRWDSLDLYNCWSAVVAGCRFYVGDKATACEAKSVWDGRDGGTYGNETSVTGEQVQVTFSDCWFVGEPDARNWVAVSAVAYSRNGYTAASGSGYTGKHVHMVRCRLWGQSGSMVEAADASVAMRDCRVDKAAGEPNRLVTLMGGSLDMDALVRLEACEGTIAWRSWRESSHTRVEAYDSVLYLVVINDAITLNNVMFARCRFNTDGRVAVSPYGCYSAAAGTIVMRDCEYTNFKLAKGRLEAYGCRMDSLGVWDSMRLEHCHTRDINTGAITGRVEYRDLTYDTGTPDKNKLTPLITKAL